MLDRATTIEKLKGTRQYLSEHYGVSSMMLFGSVARNEQKEDSDVDVVRMREELTPVFKRQIQKYGIRVY